MKINEVIGLLEKLAHPSFQEDYDNSKLLTGDSSEECKGVLISLDCLETVVDEAIKKNCNLVISHHPIIFSGLKSLSGKNYIERTIIKAIRNNIAIYAIHTNLDNVIKGVNGKMAELFGLNNIKVLQPRNANLRKLVTFAPLDVAEKVREALFAAGGGNIGKYSECSFNIEGTGTFKPLEGADPHTGEIGKRYEGKELKIEIIFPSYLQDKIVAEMQRSHPYEEVAYDILSLGNYLSDVGSGVVGDLREEMVLNDFLQLLKSTFKLSVIKHTRPLKNTVKKIALCGGAGSFLIPAAIQNQADIFITSDLKYHQFFDADDKIVLADIGHFESEQFTIDLLYEYLKQKNLNFAVLKSEIITNPVMYFL